MSQAESLRPEGYVYVADEVPGVMTAARKGTRISCERRKPPYIVVDSSFRSVIVARWPGKLWYVRIVDAVTKADELANGLVRPVDSAGYTRAVTVDVLDEVPSSQLFGDNGEGVCAVIARASQVKQGQVSSLREARHPDAGKAYSRAWNNWLASVGGTSAYRNEDLSGTLGIDAGGSRSPINCGFTVLHGMLRNRAQIIAPTSVFVIEDGEEYFDPIWSSALDALLEAAMAIGAPEFSCDEDRRIMLASWDSVFGPK